MTDTTNTSSAQAIATDKIRSAQDLLQTDRAKGLEALNETFRAGHPPEPPIDGSCDGELIALVDLGVTLPFARTLLAMWLPWKGKHLSASESCGDNIFGQNYRWLFKLLYPFYRGIIDVDNQTFRALKFKTSIKPGLDDTDRQVLNIDYDLPDNPKLTIRPIIDELMQVDPGVYLGKIHFKWWWGKRQMLGYFSLRSRK